MLKYGRNEKMTLSVFSCHERQKLFWGIIICIRRVPPSHLVVVTFLLTALRNGYLKAKYEMQKNLSETYFTVSEFNSIEFK